MKVPYHMIIRRRRNSNFTVIGNEPANDTRLSADALGVLTYLLTRPDNWKVIPEQLSKRFDCGRAKMYRILRLLVETGYVQRHQYRDVQRRVFGRIEYAVYDERPEPCVEIDNTASEPRVDFEHADEPHAGSEHTENRHALIRTDSQQGRKGRKTDRQQGPATPGLVIEDTHIGVAGGLS
jgi:hypothetical protein